MASSNNEQDEIGIASCPANISIGPPSHFCEIGVRGAAWLLAGFQDDIRVDKSVSAQAVRWWNLV